MALDDVEEGSTKYGTLAANKTERGWGRTALAALALCGLAACAVSAQPSVALSGKIIRFHWKWHRPDCEGKTIHEGPCGDKDHGCCRIQSTGGVGECMRWYEYIDELEPDYFKRESDYRWICTNKKVDASDFWYLWAGDLEERELCNYDEQCRAYQGKVSYMKMQCGSAWDKKRWKADKGYKRCTTNN